MPWRALPGEMPDPYRVWLSEIMLQQTTVAAVKPYFDRFLALFPDVEALAAAPAEQVMSAWAGLGYYARARNLHACAKAVTALGGAFPRDLEGLRALPGIGEYTARAVGAIAFGLPVVPVDGNVERVTARLFAIDAPLPGARRTLAAKAATLNAAPEAQARASDFAQALFDLGATICTPRRPLCALCPWRPSCDGAATGAPERLPVRAAKAVKPERHGVHFLLRDRTGAIWLRTRPDRGLLGGMTELPGTPWTDAPWNVPGTTGNGQDALPFAPLAAQWRVVGTVRHVFTHFALTIIVVAADVQDFSALRDGFAADETGLARHALPSVMRKCIELDGRETGSRE